MEDGDPDAPDIAAACAAAIVWPALATAFATFMLTLLFGPAALFLAVVGFVFALIIAALHVGLLGLPLYLLLRRVIEPDWRVAALCGAVLGVVPCLLIALSSGESSAGLVFVVAIFGFMGLIGGLSFGWKLYG